MSKRAEDPFGAVADPTRRAILDLLAEHSSMTAGAIASVFPQMTRPAISKHLRVLRAADLVRASEIGREWHYELHAVPLQELYADWLVKFAPFWERSLEQLKRHAEGPSRKARMSSARPAGSRR